MTQTRYKTKQQVFDKVWKHFVVDKNPQSAIFNTHDNHSTCQYAGTGCAIGCLVEDKAICKKWDEAWHKGLTISDVVTRFPDDIKTIFELNQELLDFLSALQRRHDSWTDERAISFTDYIEQELKHLALKHSLEIPT